MILPAAPRRWPLASARNMAVLVQMRWIAVVGQLVTIWAAAFVMQVGLPLPQLIAVPALLGIANLATAVLGRDRAGYSYGELLGALMLDVAALCWQLYFSGGATNPFTFLFLLQIVIGAILLPPHWSWVVAAVASCCVALLTFAYRPLVLPAPYAADPFRLYLLGSLLCFALNAALLVFFVIRMDRNRRHSDRALATLRQQAAEEHHIVRMGLLASGAAHELGTPMATMSVILGDWARHPAVVADTELLGELGEMQTELKRCKSIVSGILMSAGEARGENPSIIRLHAFLDEISREWAQRSGGAVHFRPAIAEDIAIVADPALRQVIGNIIDNALEVSPDSVDIVARTMKDQLVLEVRDRGPGFSADMLESFGRPYASTKGRPGGGLGLFLVVNVVRKLGGKVIVSNPVDGGALVRLTIPLPSLAYASNTRARIGTSIGPDAA